MKNRISISLLGLLVLFVLSGCGANPELTRFRNEIDAFCTSISDIDTSINSVNAESQYAVSELLGYLSNLEEEFNNFAQLDFPEEFDYLEELADEAGEYMSTAVASYKELYSGDFYDKSKAEYAKENYSRAYKRIQIIISFLHGEEPAEEDLTTSAAE